MKTIRIRFEQNPALDDIEVLIRAAEEDPQILAMIRHLSDTSLESIPVYDRNEVQRMIPVKEIVSINANGKLINVVTDNDNFYLRQPLKNLECTLDERRVWWNQIK